MYKAIVNGKVRNNFSFFEEGKSWRTFYKEREDFLTAAIISRLLYLPSEVVWRIIKSNMSNKASSFLPVHPGKIDDYQFWPRYWLGGNYVEPDCVIHFENVAIIIEAKLSDSSMNQSSDQLVREYNAYIENRAREEQRPVLILAVGGLDSDREQEIDELIGAVNENLRAKGRNDFLVHALPWKTLRDSLNNLPVPDEDEKRFLIEDIKEIFDFHDINLLADISCVVNFCKKISIDLSVLSLMRG
ncbi:MAG: hypothetical protein GF401_19620 [Chitinivibrionales bacterium]|nr:hypothetical protein [Chitinivibrionales bacterium]